MPRRTALGLAGLVACSVVVYLPALHASFVADDYVLRDTVARVNGPLWPFSHNHLGFGGETGGFYRPLWVLYNAGVDRLFGGSAVAYHAGSFVLYAIVAVEVWALARRLLGTPEAWIAAVAFAVYPRHGESVAWISGNTDLLPAAIGLAALLCALAPWSLPVRAGTAAALAAAAALSKEVAFVLPFLAVLLLWAHSRRRDIPWIVPGAMLAAQLVVLAVRIDVVGGLGGYREYPWTPRRAAGALVSDILAALSPSQLELGRHPWLVLFPLLALGVAVRAVLRVRDPARRRVVAAGVAWFFLALIPSLNLVIDLNTANGERLLFLPSVGLALVFAALVRRPSPMLLGAAGAVAAALCLQNADNWLVAGRIADRVLSEATGLSPPSGELVLVTVPESFRTAHVFLPGLDKAIDQRTDSARDTAWCIPVELTEARVGVVTVRAEGQSSYAADTSWRAPFDFPVFRDPSPLTADCGYARAGGGRWPPGLGLHARADLHPARQPVVLAYFDGRDVRRAG